MYTRDQILTLLDTNDRAVERGIVRIYQRQTQDEQSSQATKHSNGVGFSGADASLGSYYAKWLLSGKHLTGNHLAKGRKMIRKYAGQLVDIANSRLQ